METNVPADGRIRVVVGAPTRQLTAAEKDEIARMLWAHVGLMQDTPRIDYDESYEKTTQEILSERLAWLSLDEDERAPWEEMANVVSYYMLSILCGNKPQGMP